MGLNIEKIKKINQLVFERPRNVNEIAHALNVNWRTADRYVEELVKQVGEISTHTFREGTRGALKIAYWKNVERAPMPKYKELLFDNIMKGVSKADFSPFDIYEYADPGKRSAFWEEKEARSTVFYGTQEVKNLLLKAEHEFLSFSGDISWINIVEDKSSILNVLKTLLKRKVVVKILGKIDFTSMDNAEKILSLNKNSRSNTIDMRHIYQPLRGAIIDEKIIRLIETVPSRGRTGERTVFYEITDAEWIVWLRDVFWKLYNKGVPADKRIEDLRSIHRLPNGGG